MKRFSCVLLLAFCAVSAHALDLGGYTVRQTNTVRNYTLPGGTIVDPGDYIVIGRSASQSQFETYWGVTLGTNVTYLNAANNFPRIDGQERFSLLNAGNTNIDGQTPSSIDPLNKSVQRKGATNSAGSASSWNALSWSLATPGSGCSGVTSNGLVISEYADAGSFQYEFVELYCSVAGTPSNIPPVLLPIQNTAITISNTLSFAVTATPTDTNTVTLSVSNNLAGSFLSSTNEYGTFFWTNPAPLGVYTTKFYAANKWGASCKTVTVSVLDPPTVRFAATEYTASEDVGTQLVQIVLSRQADATVQVSVAGTATTNLDFMMVSTTAIFSAIGPTQVTVGIVISNDNVSESTETILLTLTNPASASVGAPSQGTVYIRDNDAITIMTANLVTGADSKYYDPGTRIMRGLKPDIVGLQEWKITNASFRNFVDVNFGTNFSYYIEPQSTNYFPIPNGIVSRWPMKASGEWADPITVNRDFAWATIDIPGDRDLHVVCCHLYSSGTDADRADEARYITNYIAKAGWPSNDYVVICGDMNLITRTDPAMLVLTNIVSDSHKPADQNGDTDSNSNRTKPFDYVLPGPSLNANYRTVDLGGLQFTNGIVFDSRLWTNPPPPILTNDSAAVNADHMAVMKAFNLGKTPPALQHIGRQRVVLNGLLQFDVQALATDGDSYTLTASNLPPGASFTVVTNTFSTFTWAGASPVGIYTTSFYAVDIDGAESESVEIKVLVDGHLWINELHYDNASVDTNEGVEIAGTAGMDLSLYCVCAYNGGDGTIYATNPLSGVIDDEGCGYGAIWVPYPGLQNGPDGVALVLDDTNVVQFLSYEGVIVAVDGPAVEMSSTDIGVFESGSEPVGRSLQLTGSGTNYDAFAWGGSTNTASRGFLNSRQTIFPCNAGTNQPPVLFSIGDKTTIINTSLQFTVTASDALDGDAITLWATGVPPWAVFTTVTNAGGVTNTFSGTPTGVTTCVTTFFAADKDGTNKETVTISAVTGTEKPAIQTVGNKSVSVSNTLSFAVVATDAENDPIALTESNAPAGSTFSVTNGSGTFTWTNAAPIGVYTTRFYAVDIDGVDTERVVITVGAATNLPVLQPIASQWVMERTTLAFDVMAADVDGDPITLTVSNAPAGSTFGATGGSGTFIWTNASPTGTYASTFYATDNDGTVTQSVTMKVLLNGEIWINEVHYDNIGNDTNEGVEIAGTAGMDLSYFVLYAYNGGDGNIYKSNGLSGTIDDEGCGYGAVWFAITNLQNGPDGISLVLDGSNVAQFLSYGGTITASNGPADGLTSDNMKVTESNVTTPTNYSLQLTGIGTNYIQFAWGAPTNLATPGRLNDLQWVCTNKPPYLFPIGGKSAIDKATLAFTISAAEPDRETILYSVSNAPAGSTMNPSTGLFTWTNATPIGVYTSTFYAADKDGSTGETITITIQANTNLNPTVLAYYDFENGAGGFTNAPGGSHSNITASLYAPDDGTYTDQAGSPGRAISENGWTTAGHNLSFSITVTPGYQVNITGLQFSVYRSATGPSNWVVRYSGDSYATDLGAGTQPQATAWLTNSAPLSLAGLTGTITFRIFGTNASSSAGTWRHDNVQLLGSVELAPNNDVDSDGLPNDWETLYFGDQTSAVPTADSDTDTLNNIQEYIAGTVPTNRSSIFAAEAFWTNLSGSVRFNSITNRVYGLYYKTNLFDASWLPWLTNIPGSNVTMSITVTNRPDPSYFKPGVHIP